MCISFVSFQVTHLTSGRTRLGVSSAMALCLAGCVQMPTAPSVAVMPAANKPFDVFIQDDQLCRGWAAHSIGLPGHDAAAETMLRSTATGTAIGMLAGAIVGRDRQASAGAATGTVIGAMAGVQQGATTAWQAQRRYDVAYQQCMYSKGNQVPTYEYGSYRYLAPPSPAMSIPTVPLEK